MKVVRVSVEFGLPDKFEDNLKATITFEPDQPESTHIWLPKTDMTLEQLTIVGEFLAKVSRLGSRIEELVKSTMEI